MASSSAGVPYLLPGHCFSAQSSCQERMKGAITAAAQPPYAPAASALPGLPHQKTLTLTCSPDAAGDTTRNLVWRLEHGEGPERLRPAVVVLQIGTNDLTQPEHPLARAALPKQQRSPHDVLILLLRSSSTSCAGTVCTVLR